MKVKTCRLIPHSVYGKLALLVSAFTLLIWWRLSVAQFRRMSYADQQISTHGLDTQSSATQLLRLLISESRHERLVFMAQVQANITALTAKYLHHTTKLIYGPVDLQQIKSWTDKMNYFHPVLPTAHSLECEAHSPGLLSVTDRHSRKYCFGATTLKGNRVCDRSEPSYMTADTVETPIETLLYGHKFLARPFRLKSQATRDCERQPETCEQHITITTQGTWNRHDTLLHLASIWKGPISFALLVNTDREAAEAVAMCQDVPNCRQYIDLHISVRAGHVAEHTGSFYPINYLRNLAMHNVRTKLLYQLDVDNLPNESHAQYVVWMTAAMADPDVMDADTSADCPGLHVFVPPAFEMTADDLNTIVTLKDGSPTIPKKALVDAALSGVALPMHGYYPPAYGPTGHNAWLTSGQTVRLNYVTRFEPYYIASVPVPLFNETFVNRGGNYAQQVYEMAAAGYSFWRLPQAFIIDIPHSKATCAHAAHDDAEPGTTGVLADIHQDDIGDTETATETSDNSDTNKDTNSATASAAVLVMSNESGQLDQTGALVSSLWLNFWEHICHRYGTHAPHPDSKEPYFADYRLSLGDLFSAQKLRLDTVPMVEPSTDSRRDEHR